MAIVSQPSTPVSSSAEQVETKAKSEPAGGSPTTVTSLYVCDLDTSVTESQLYDFFSEAGPVLSVKVCRDHLTRVSLLAHGYVNYSNPQHARKALESLNFKPINGKPVRIMLSNRDSSIRRSERANVFFKDFDPSIDCKTLHMTFSEFGAVLSCKLVTDTNGVSKGYGYVQFDKEEAAKEAIDQLCGMVVNGEQIYVGPFIRKEERDNSEIEDPDKTVFVKSSSVSVDEYDLNPVFEQYGVIKSLYVVSGKGFGFVGFESPDSAASAIEKLNGYRHYDDIWYVGWAKKKSDRKAEMKSKFEQGRNSKFEKLRGANLYVKNLDDSINDERLKELFYEFGRITSCKVMLDSHGQSRCFGFVAFDTVADATKAVNEMNGKMIGQKPLYVAVAQNKEERKASLLACTN